MPTNKKIETVVKLEEALKNSKGIYLTNYTGLNVAQMTELRNQFRRSKIDYRVTKNTLTKIAAKNVDLVGIEDLLNGQIGIAYSYDDPSAPARVIKEFAKDNQDLDVVGIVFEGQRFEGVEFKAIANLPSREDLYSKILSALSQPMTNLASTLNGSMAKLAFTLESLKQTKS